MFCVVCRLFVVGCGLLRSVSCLLFVVCWVLNVVGCFGCWLLVAWYVVVGCWLIVVSCLFMVHCGVLVASCFLVVCRFLRVGC